MEPESDLLRTEFGELVRSALVHLYDAAYLQTHPLAHRVAEEASDDNGVFRGKRLLQDLLDAIEALQPAAGASSDSRPWRTYHLMELRYVEGMSVGEVLDHLALSKTQYQRDHTRALDAVASILADRWRIEPAKPRRATALQLREILALTEAEDVASHFYPKDVDLADLLGGLLALLTHLCTENHTTVSLHEPPGLPLSSGDPMALRQIFLGLLNTAIDYSAGGSLDISLGTCDFGVRATLVASRGSSAEKPRRISGRASPEIAVTRRLVEALGGEIHVESTELSGPWVVTVSLPVAHQQVILVLDNHPDFVNLVARYLSGQDWQVIGAGDVPQAESLIHERLPTIILLDVMLPEHDGWELLHTLKTRPETRSIPVIVCSVLYEPQVARALGAVDYIPKPISQAALLKVLSRYRRGIPGPGLTC